MPYIRERDIEEVYNMVLKLISLSHFHIFMIMQDICLYSIIVEV